MSADPAGDFASDVHRRVMAAVPIPGDDPLPLEDLVDWKIAGDDHLDVDEEEVTEVLKDLEADGHVKETQKGWRHTKAGHDLLTGPPQGVRNE